MKIKSLKESGPFDAMEPAEFVMKAAETIASYVAHRANKMEGDDQEALRLWLLATLKDAYNFGVKYGSDLVVML